MTSNIFQKMLTNAVPFICPQLRHFLFSSTFPCQWNFVFKQSTMYHLPPPKNLAQFDIWKGIYWAFKVLLFILYFLQFSCFLYTPLFVEPKLLSNHIQSSDRANYFFVSSVCTVHFFRNQSPPNFISWLKRKTCKSSRRFR